MNAIVLAGRPVSDLIRRSVTAKVFQLGRLGHRARMVVVSATADGTAAAYTRTLQEFGVDVGVEVVVRDLGPDAGEARIRAAVEDVSRDPSVHGIMVQSPLPSGIRRPELGRAIVPEKDIDGANPLSLGRLAARQRAFAPAAASAVLALLDHYDVGVRGARVVIVGRSLSVGQPLIQLLLHRDATVTVCHSATADLAEVTRHADILVAAAGHSRLIGADGVRPGAVVVDVGVSVDEHLRLSGDVDGEAVAPVAAAVSAVPDGVGAITTALLFRNTMHSAVRANLDASQEAAGAIRSDLAPRPADVSPSTP